MVLYLLGLSWYRSRLVVVIFFRNKWLLVKLELQTGSIGKPHSYIYPYVIILKQRQYLDIYLVLNTLCTEEVVSKVENYLSDYGIIFWVIFLVQAVAVKSACPD